MPNTALSTRELTRQIRALLSQDLHSSEDIRGEGTVFNRVTRESTSKDVTFKLFSQGGEDRRPEEEGSKKREQQAQRTG